LQWYKKLCIFSAMKPLLIITIILFIAFLVVLIIALVKGRKKMLYIAIGLFVGTAITGGLSVSRAFNKLSTAMANVEPRSGEKMYEQTLSDSALDCVKIINAHDRADFLRSCCIWLEFETCPAEIDRIPADHKTDMTKLDIEKLEAWAPETREKPNWWKPETLGDSAFIINFEFPIPGIERKMFLSADSTKAFFFERMDPVFKNDSTAN
jgi:hypothetical protein